jgi:putative endonuclease
MPNLRVYILQCADNSLYTGVTNNIERRIDEHNSGYNESGYTYVRRPVTLKWISDELPPETAIALEKKLKRWSNKKKQAIIEGKWDELVSLSKKKFD